MNAGSAYDCELQIVSAESGYAEVRERVVTKLALGEGEGGRVAGMFEG